MSFHKGQSGNPKGRPKQTEEEKQEKEKFKSLLRKSTVSALESIISIAGDKYNKDRFNACKFIIEKAYGSDVALMLDEREDVGPLVINLIARKNDEEQWEQEWDNAIDCGEN